MLEDRARLPKPIGLLIVGAIATATLLALLWPYLPWAEARRIATGPTKVGVITTQRENGGAGRVDAVAPDFEWVAPDGRRVSLSSLRKPAVVNFWATWCEPCKREMPLLDRAAATWSDVAFLAVDLDEDGDRIRAFFDGIGVTRIEPLVDVGLETSRRYGLASVPSTFFVDGGGTIRHVRIGELDDAELSLGLGLIQ